MPQMTAPRWRLANWPREVGPSDVHKPVRAPDWRAAVEKIGPTKPGRYLIINEETPERAQTTREPGGRHSGQYFRLEPDGTTVPDDGV